MAVTMARHVKFVAESGAASVVATRQGVVEPRNIYRREWSRFVAITVATLKSVLCLNKNGVLE